MKITRIEDVYTVPKTEADWAMLPADRESWCRNEVGVGSIVQKYRSAISGRKRWVALRLFNSDVGLVGYYGLSEDEKKEVDLLVGMARESL